MANGKRQKYGRRFILTVSASSHLPFTFLLLPFKYGKAKHLNLAAVTDG
jgi:hypothetical protein